MVLIAIIFLPHFFLLQLNLTYMKLILQLVPWSQSKLSVLCPLTIGSNIDKNFENTLMARDPTPSAVMANAIKNIHIFLEYFPKQRY